MIELLDSGIVKAFLALIVGLTVALLGFASKMILGNKSNRIAEITALLATYKDLTEEHRIEIDRLTKKLRHYEEKEDHDLFDPDLKEAE